MADELDRKLIPGFMQTTFEVYLGAAFKSFEMMKKPQESIPKMFSEMRSLVTIPSDAGEGLEKKAQALAAVWMEKGASLMEDCKTTGQKFTEGK
jgi:hypothetical protein